MAKIQTTKPTTTIDRIRAVYPRYADLLQKNSELHDRYKEVLATAAPLNEEARKSQASWTAQLPKPKPQPKHRHSGAVAILGELLPPQPEAELNPPPPRPSWPGEQRHRALGVEAENIAAAIALLIPELAKARREYSKIVAAQRGAAYKTVAADVIQAARKLGDAIIEHHRWISAQREDGVAYREFRPLNLERFGNMDAGTPLFQIITDAVEFGHVGAENGAAWKMPADIALFSGGN